MSGRKPVTHTTTLVGRKSLDFGCGQVMFTVSGYTRVRKVLSILQSAWTVKCLSSFLILSLSPSVFADAAA